LFDVIENRLWSDFGKDVFQFILVLLPLITIFPVLRGHSIPFDECIVKKSILSKKGEQISVRPGFSKIKTLYGVDCQSTP
jgi:hypothetical protein